MRRKLCLGCSLAGSGLCLLLLAEIPFPFCFTIASCHKKMSFCDKIISLPLVSGIMLLRSAVLYMLLLTLGSRRSDRLVLSLAIFIFMMKFGLSCQSLETYKPSCATSSLEQTSRRMQLSFTQPTADIFYSSFSFIFLDEASTLTFSAAKLVQATFLQVPGALFSEFFQKLFRLLLIQKTFPAQG